MQNCETARAVLKQESFPLANEIGKTVRELNVLLRQRPELKWPGISAIRNNAWIDPRSNSSLRDGWKGLKFPGLNDNGDITEDYVIVEGDEARMYVYHVFHATCLEEVRSARRAEEAKKSAEMFLAITEQAGFWDVRLEPAVCPPLPDHGTDEVPPVLGSEHYYRFTTAQGSFGFIFFTMWEPPLLDLRDSGLTCLDVTREIYKADPNAVTDEPSLSDEEIAARPFLAIMQGPPEAAALLAAFENKKR